jgi:hypothetical protein
VTAAATAAKAAAERLPALEQATKAAAAAVDAAQVDLKTKRDAYVMLRLASVEGAAVDGKLLATRERAVSAAESNLANAEATQRALADKFAEERDVATFEARQAAARVYVEARDAQAVIVARMVECADTQAADAAELRKLAASARTAAVAAFGKNQPLIDYGPSVSALASYMETVVLGERRTGSRLLVADLRADLTAPWRPNHGGLAERLKELDV